MHGASVSTQIVAVVVGHVTQQRTEDQTSHRRNISIRLDSSVIHGQANHLW